MRKQKKIYHVLMTTTLENLKYHLQMRLKTFIICPHGIEKRVNKLRILSTSVIQLNLTDNSTFNPLTSLHSQLITLHWLPKTPSPHLHLQKNHITVLKNSLYQLLTCLFQLPHTRGLRHGTSLNGYLNQPLGGVLAAMDALSLHFPQQNSFIPFHLLPLTPCNHSIKL